MAISRHRGFQRSGRKQRQTVWSAGPFSAAIQSATAGVNTIIDTGQSSGGGVTIIRIRGELTMWLEVVTAIGDGFTRVGAGIGIVSTDAFSAGAGSMPAPLSDPGWGGWMWFYGGGAMIGASTTETFRGPMEAVRIPIDTKAMRKIHDNETVFGAVQTVTEVGTATLSFSMGSRMLSKLG